MNRKVTAAFGVLSLVTCLAPLAGAQTSEVKEKSPIYIYISEFNVPRANWADYDKMTDEDTKLMDRAVASGTIIGFGDDHNLVHQAEGYTHDNWFVATSMAGLMSVLEQEMKATFNTSAALTGTTKHEDSVDVSRFYNWKPGTYKGAYTLGATYKLKADAPDDAIETLSKTTIVPVLEKLLSDGSIVEYDIDTQALHTSTPGMFFIYITAPGAEGLDKFRAAQRDAIKASPLFSPAFDSMVDYTGHRDTLSRTNATFK